MIPVLEGAGHRVIAMDHVGMGRSDKPIDPDYYTYQDQVDRLETFMCYRPNYLISVWPN
jgi:haloalkane dehalogenase